MPSPTRRYYSSTAVAGTLTATLGSADTTMVVSSIAGWPATRPYTVIIGEDTTSEELVTVTAGTTTTLTITRGVGGTSGQAHGIGETVRHGIYAQDFEDGAAHYAASTAVHGVTGSVVGNSDTQTLTNKTISGASNTLSNIPSSAISGVTGDIVGTTSTQTLTNKTLTSPVLTTPTLTTGGAVVGTTETQTLTNKTISGASNTLSAIPSASVTGVDTHIAATAVHGATGAVVGTTNAQTLTNKTISGSSNTLSAIPQSAIVGVSGTLVSTDATQTLTNKTISGSSNALSNIAYSSTAATAWTSYTPVWSSSGSAPGLGNGTLTGAYVQVGKIVHFRIRLRAGSTTTFGTGSFRFTLPVETVAVFTGAGEIVGQGSLLDNSAGDRYVRHAYTFSSTIVSLVDGAGAAVTNTVPFTWANLDNLSIVGTYEAL
jgi:hypothetical protein